MCGQYCLTRMWFKYIGYANEEILINTGICISSKFDLLHLSESGFIQYFAFLKFPSAVQSILQGCYKHFVLFGNFSLSSYPVIYLELCCLKIFKRLATDTVGLKRVFRIVS